MSNKKSPKKKVAEPMTFDSMWIDVMADDALINKAYHGMLSGFIVSEKLEPIPTYKDMDIDNDKMTTEIVTLLNIASSKIHTDFDCCMGAVMKCALIAIYNQGGNNWMEKFILNRSRTIIDALEAHSVEEYNNMNKVKCLLYILDTKCSLLQLKLELEDKGESKTV